MIKIGSVINGYVVVGVYSNRHCIAKAINEAVPEPYVVWQIDFDCKGVSTGRYFVKLEDAEWEYASLCFPWFQDNAKLT